MLVFVLRLRHFITLHESVRTLVDTTIGSCCPYVVLCIEAEITVCFFSVVVIVMCFQIVLTCTVVSLKCLNICCIYMASDTETEAVTHVQRCSYPYVRGVYRDAVLTLCRLFLLM